MIEQFYNQGNSGQPRIVMPGYDGIPFRGVVPDLVKGGKTPIERLYAKVRIFDLSDAKQLEEYQSICDVIAKGWCALSREEIQWVEEKKSWIVFIRYVERFAEMEGELERRAYYDTQKGVMAYKQDE